MTFVGIFVGEMLVSAFLCTFGIFKSSKIKHLRQHRVAETVAFAGSSPVRSATIKPRKSLICGAFLCLKYFPLLVLSVFCRWEAAE